MRKNIHSSSFDSSSHSPSCWNETVSTFMRGQLGKAVSSFIWVYFSSAVCSHSLNPCHLPAPYSSSHSPPGVRPLMFLLSAKPYLPIRLQQSFSLTVTFLLPHWNIFHRLGKSVRFCPLGPCLFLFKLACCRSPGPTKHSLVAVNGPFHCSSGSFLFTM